MAKLPVKIPELVAQFGPHLNRDPPEGWGAQFQSDRMVKDALLFLRPTMRHSTQGQRQQGDRL